MAIDCTVIPQIGDIWQDANGKYNLVVGMSNPRYLLYIVLCLDTGTYWREEDIRDWNYPERCTKRDGMPFYRVLVA